MHDNTINNTLAELEDNLKKMDSARMQVTSLSDSVRELTLKYSKSLVQLQKIQDSIHYDENFFIEKFGASIQVLDKNISLLQSTVLDKSNSINVIHKNASTEFISNLKKSEERIHQYVKQIEPALHKVQDTFYNNHAEIISNLNTQIVKLIETSSQKINEINNLNLLQNVKTIEESTVEIYHKHNQLVELIENTNSNIDKKFNNVFKENNSIKSEISRINEEVDEKLKKTNNYLKILLGVIIVFFFLGLAIMKMS